MVIIEQHPLEVRVQDHESERLGPTQVHVRRWADTRNQRGAREFKVCNFWQLSDKVVDWDNSKGAHLPVEFGRGRALSTFEINL